MQSSNLGSLSLIDNNPLHITWHDSAWIPILNSSNVLDYFCERSNPFYDRTCNNESVKMQGLDPEIHLKNMTGIEYVLIHSQEPILYVIRKQHRHRINSNNTSSNSQSASQIIMGTTPLADYYIIAGVVYQSPDLASVLNTRILTALYNCQIAFSDALSLSNSIFKQTKELSIKSETIEFGISHLLTNNDDPYNIEAQRSHRQRIDFILQDIVLKAKQKYIETPSIQQTIIKTIPENKIVTEELKIANQAKPDTSK